MLEVAPLILAHPVVPLSLRSHCQEVVGVGSPVALAAVAVSVSPTLAVPAIVGTPLILGAAGITGAASIGPKSLVSALVLLILLVAVT